MSLLRNMTHGASVPALAATLTGCMVGPDYAGPPTVVTAAESGEPFRRIGDLPTQTLVADAAWWQAFGDPMLDRLIEQALKTSPSIAIAEARLRRSRAMVRQNEVNLLPSAGVSASYLRYRLPLSGLGDSSEAVGSNGGAPGEVASLPDDATGGLWPAGFDAMWEIDLFGGRRRQRDASRAHARGSRTSPSYAQLRPWPVEQQRASGVLLSLSTLIGILIGNVGRSRSALSVCIGAGERLTTAANESFGRAEFERSFRAVLPNLIGFARSLARDHDAAQDLVQETALRAWAARSRFVKGTNFKAWCYRILRNCFLSQIRHQQVARTENRGDDLPEVPIAPNQEAAFEVQDVARIWRRLSNNQQRSLALVAIDGHSYEVAASMDNVPLGTMKSRVARARETLLALLDGEPRARASELAEPDDDCKASSEMPVLTAPVTSPVTASAIDQSQVELLREWRERRRMAAMAIAA